MEFWTARPERIVGNIALASLWTMPLGIVMGLAITVFGSHHPRVADILKIAGENMLVVPVVTFICGIVLIAPLLLLMRSFGFGGPGIVYALGILIGCSFFSLGIAAGFCVLSIALMACYVFCRNAYSFPD